MGTPIKIGGRDFDVPRLRVGAYDRAMEAVERADKLQQGDDPDGRMRLNFICGAIVELLKENHPDLTVGEIKDLVYVDDLDTALTGVLAATGKKKAAPGEEVSP
jgi:hypothetical protein